MAIMSDLEGDYLVAWVCKSLHDPLGMHPDAFAMMKEYVAFIRDREIRQTIEGLLGMTYQDSEGRFHFVELVSAPQEVSHHG